MTMARDIACVGDVDESETSSGDCQGCNFMRVRVVIDVLKPLCRGQKIALRSGEESWVSFKYE